MRYSFTIPPSTSLEAGATLLKKHGLIVESVCGSTFLVLDEEGIFGRHDEDPVIPDDLQEIAVDVRRLTKDRPVADAADSTCDGC